LNIPGFLLNIAEVQGTRGWNRGKEGALYGRKNKTSMADALAAAKADDLLAFWITAEKDLTLEQCLAAVRQNSRAIRGVPEKQSRLASPAKRYIVLTMAGYL
jgi:hypothetical protein